MDYASDSLVHSYGDYLEKELSLLVTVECRVLVQAVTLFQSSSQLT